MVRLSSLCRALLLLLVATSASAHPSSDKTPRSPAEWTNGYTLVLFDASTKGELSDARDFIVAQGGTVAILLPPHVILGWITPEVGAKIVGRHGIRSVHRSALDAAASGFNDRETRIAV